jgi:hypothetical protein
MLLLLLLLAGRVAHLLHHLELVVLLLLLLLLQLVVVVAGRRRLLLLLLLLLHRLQHARPLNLHHHRLPLRSTRHCSAACHQQRTDCNAEHPTVMKCAPLPVLGL